MKFIDTTHTGKEAEARALYLHTSSEAAQRAEVTPAEAESSRSGNTAHQQRTPAEAAGSAEDAARKR